MSTQDLYRIVMVLGELVSLIRRADELGLELVELLKQPRSPSINLELCKLLKQLAPAGVAASKQFSLVFQRLEQLSKVSG